ncbi:MAG: hypothetical protein IPK82_09250 [Polyangiaceae bacterium]|nr:hypothetical protein [Polyangiaceae bacterium]
MNRKMMLRLATVPFLVAGAAVPAVSGCDVAKEVGCPEFSAEGEFGANLDIDADVRTFMVAAGTLSVLGDDMVASVSAACVDIATAAGRDPSAWDGKEGSELVKAACDEATLGLDAVFAAAGNASLQVYVTGGECRVDVDASADCYAKCDVSGQCTPGELEVQCEPGKLAGSCSGSCSGSCEGGTIACQGECSATCTGSCNAECIGKCDGADSTGVCNGECVGQCRGTCDGTCSGSCTYQELTCEGTCTGNCSVEFQEPYCTGKIVEPSCDLDAECKAQCEASIQAEAVCTPPDVDIAIVGEGTAELAAVVDALVVHLPILIELGVERGQVAVDAATSLADSGQAIVDKAGELTVKAGVCAAVAADAAIAASINIEVSVKASASVSSSAGARAQ